jgi:hypothetical protein
MDQSTTAEVHFYRYLEQDERLLAAIAKSEEARDAHLLMAAQYRELAERAATAGTAVLRVA